jgi:hypothetical protein
MARAYQRWSKIGAYDNGWTYRFGLNWSRSWLRRNRDELIMVGAVGRSRTLAGTSDSPNVLIILWSSDGVAWSRYDITLDNDLEVGGSLIAVTDDRLLVELRADDIDTGEMSSRSGFAIVER